MAELNKTPNYFFIVGPTCTGKSSLALEISKELRGSIINCDSIQVYKSVDIGTAKPSEEDRESYPHYLFDIVDEGERYTVAQYVEDAVGLLEDLSPQNALFCGGSGFYIQALEKGLYPNVKASAKLIEKVDRWIDEKGYEALYQWIQKKDPECAQALSPNDHYRLKRSMQIMMAQKTTITELKKRVAEKSQSPLPPHRRMKVGLVDEKLAMQDKVRTRTRKMLEDGWLNEVEALLKKNLGGWAPMQSVGYKEIQMFFRDEIPKNSLEDRIVTSTMQLIKKQMTWFKRDREIEWFSSSQVEKAYDYAMSWSKESLS